MGFTVDGSFSTGSIMARLRDAVLLSTCYEFQLMLDSEEANDPEAVRCHNPQLQNRTNRKPSTMKPQIENLTPKPLKAEATKPEPLTPKP